VDEENELWNENKYKYNFKYFIMCRQSDEMIVQNNQNGGPRSNKCSSQN